MVGANGLQQPANDVDGAITIDEQNPFPLPNHAGSLGSMARSMLLTQWRRIG
jgi:hypothetical protein